MFSAFFATNFKLRPVLPAGKPMKKAKSIPRDAPPALELTDALADIDDAAADCLLLDAGEMNGLPLGPPTEPAEDESWPPANDCSLS
jgi:hypothetical protein